MKHFIYNKGDLEEISCESFELCSLPIRPGIFETVRIFDNKITLLDYHLERFYLGAKVMGLKTLPQNLLTELLELLVSRIDGIVILRFIAFKDSGKTIFSIDNQNRYSKEQHELGVKLFAREADMVNHDSSVKSLQLMNLVKHKEEAMSQGFDDCLLMSGGLISDTSVANIFWFNNGKAYTPDANTCLLQGTARRNVLRVLPNLGIEAREGGYGLDEIFEAEEVFITNSLMEVMPVSAISRNEHLINFKVGETTKKLMEAYSASWQ